MGETPVLAHCAAVYCGVAPQHGSIVPPGPIDGVEYNSEMFGARIARLNPSIPMQRAATPEEIAQGVLWLLSDAASYTTGTILEIGGGR